MPVKAVVFDYGKVISFAPDHGVMDEIAAMAGVKREILEPVVWKMRGEYDRGTCSGPQYYGKVLQSLGVNADETTLNKINEIDMHSWKRINPGTLKLMEDLKKAGYKIAILSNMPYDFLSWAREAIPVFSLPHVGIFSCEVKAIKPEEAIYRKLLSELGCKSGETVFFDDILVNVEKAKELKINAFLWQNPEIAKIQLAGLGVTV
ncbi:HAD family hydrolase [Leadbettera azotonutricia]|uniref:Putative HAD-superfamily hydrolase subfamily IA, variant 3 n=1 Tax=Leadbettera azotonutricia (strain ATCC BAA-888 / DSM 13862 / ZAS-9) TaxID=545695 RepID=F5YGA7_LEAAZ|nr:HAD family phosphatase [Leadbettera azotonutricia]AEF82632.1 putative HAD-superfamily hydrolase subfamily IA, variant 3 [Leadbettera azotonutricia ZAS-9]